MTNDTEKAEPEKDAENIGHELDRDPTLATMSTGNFLSEHRLGVAALVFGALALVAGIIAERQESMAKKQPLFPDITIMQIDAQTANQVESWTEEVKEDAKEAGGKLKEKLGSVKNIFKSKEEKEQIKEEKERLAAEEQAAAEAKELAETRAERAAKLEVAAKQQERRDRQNAFLAQYPPMVLASWVFAFCCLITGPLALVKEGEKAISGFGLFLGMLGVFWTFMPIIFMGIAGGVGAVVFLVLLAGIVQSGGL